MRTSWRLLVLAALACGAPAEGDPAGDTETDAVDDTDPADTDTPPDTTADAACGAAEVEVAFDTTDGVRLVADWRPASTAGGPALVLFHMVPPANDRTNYPPRVREALHAKGWSILNVDRRGAGDSGGDVTQATGDPQARLDLEAAVRWLLDPGRACAVDPEALVFVGASNGTTALFDYALDHDPALPLPASMVYLSPGTYTIQHHGASKAELGSTWRIQLPILWLYPSTEPFSLDFVADAPGAWEFVERGTEHGARMFDGGSLERQTLDDLTRYVGAALAPE